MSAPQAPEVKQRRAMERFWSHVDFGVRPAHRPSLGPCWVWTGACDRIGYGKVSRGGQVFPAHRVSYDMKVGTRDGLLVLHRCDNPPCVRPSHLFLGTHLDNAQDRDAKGRNRFSRGPIS